MAYIKLLLENILLKVMISAIILAAGLSKRMELGNKLLLEKETPIIKITLR